MAWEPLIVMIRKLFITLAGSLPRDPYIQISIALTILVGSITLQALVQPYESTLVNVLDVVSLFVLSFTQVLSILYLYLDTKDGMYCSTLFVINRICVVDMISIAHQVDPSFIYTLPTGPLPYGMDKDILEICMTVTLTVANASVIILLLVAWIGRITYEKMHHAQASCCRCKNAVPPQGSGDDSAGLELESVNPLKVRLKKSTARADATDMTVREAAQAQAIAELTTKIATLTAENDQLKTVQRAKAGAVTTLEVPPTESAAEKRRAEMMVKMKQRRAERKLDRNTLRGKRQEGGLGGAGS